MNQRPSSVADIPIPPARCSPWFALLTPCILAYGVSLVLRLMELPFWRPNFYQIGGEKLMATHDAYFWMAGAQGTSWATDLGLMWLLRTLHSITSVSVGNIAFFLPVILAPLAALPLCFLAWKKNMPEAGVGAGILGTGCTGYFLRTKLGFCDTDAFALFLPTFMTVAFILWTTAFTRPSWFKKTSMGTLQNNLFPQRSMTDILKNAGIGTALGLLYWLGFWFYPPSADVILSLFLVTLFEVFILATPNKQHTILFGLLCFYAVAYARWTGLGLVVLLVVALRTVPRLRTEKKYIWLTLALTGLCLFFASGLHLRCLEILSKLIHLAKTNTADPTANGTAIFFPAVQQSIREAQDIDLTGLYTRICGNAPLFWLGLFAYIYLVWKRPLFLTFFPIFILSVASVKLGNRFAMYGGIVWGTALTFGLSTLLISLKISSGKRILAQLVLCSIILWPICRLARATRPGPIIPKIYAQTFKELAQKTPRNARLWQWWDYGYAAQYYSRRMSFGDGARHNGPWLYPLALVHSTNSPMQAAQVITYMTQSQKKDFIRNGTTEEKNQLNWTEPFYNACPTTALEAMAPIQAQHFIDLLKSKQQIWTKDMPPQYFIVSWENLRLAYWISYFGNWDLITGKANPGKIQRMRGTLRFDSRKGVLLSDSAKIPLDTLDAITRTETRHFKWPNQTNLHGVINQLSKEVYIMDTKIYRSMMIQMLLAPPKQFEPFFSLCVDHYPWARAYKVTYP